VLRENSSRVFQSRSKRNCRIAVAGQEHLRDLCEGPCVSRRCLIERPYQVEALIGPLLRASRAVPCYPVDDSRDGLVLPGNQHRSAHGENIGNERVFPVLQVGQVQLLSKLFGKRGDGMWWPQALAVRGRGGGENEFSATTPEQGMHNGTPLK
jgi:hypothetical protein